jgi:RNA polymerase sigma factor (sigma-70 family)
MFLRRAHTEAASDDELLKQLRKGDRNSLGYLWDRYAHLLFGVGMKYLKDGERSKDLVVELFSDLPALIEKHEVERFKPWVHAVMRNRCLLALRGNKNGAVMPDDLLEDVAQEERESSMLRENDLQQLEQAITELNDGQRACIRHFYLDRRSYQEVADLTGHTTEQVRSHLQNGRRNLRLILERHGQRNAH